MAVLVAPSGGCRLAPRCRWPGDLPRVRAYRTALSMTRLTLRLLAEQRDRLADLLFKDESERAALALCGRSRTRDPWTGNADERFIVREIVEVPDDAYE